MGFSENSLNISSMGACSSFSIRRIASLESNGATESSRFLSSRQRSLGSRSGRSLTNWPSLTNAGPSSSIMTLILRQVVCLVIGSGGCSRFFSIFFLLKIRYFERLLFITNSWNPFRMRMLEIAWYRLKVLYRLNIYFFFETFSSSLATAS